MDVMLSPVPITPLLEGDVRELVEVTQEPMDSMALISSLVQDQALEVLEEAVIREPMETPLPDTTAVAPAPSPPCTPASVSSALVPSPSTAKEEEESAALLAYFEQLDREIDEEEERKRSMSADAAVASTAAMPEENAESPLPLTSIVTVESETQCSTLEMSNTLRALLEIPVTEIPHTTERPNWANAVKQEVVGARDSETLELVVSPVQQHQPQSPLSPTSPRTPYRTRQQSSYYTPLSSPPHPSNTPPMSLQMVRASPFASPSSGRRMSPSTRVVRQPTFSPSSPPPAPSPLSPQQQRRGTTTTTTTSPSPRSSHNLRAPSLDYWGGVQASMHNPNNRVGTGPALLLPSPIAAPPPQQHLRPQQPPQPQQHQHQHQHQRQLSMNTRPAMPVHHAIPTPPPPPQHLQHFPPPPPYMPSPAHVHRQQPSPGAPLLMRPFNGVGVGGVPSPFASTLPHLLLPHPPPTMHGASPAPSPLFTRPQNLQPHHHQPQHQQQQSSSPHSMPPSPFQVRYAQRGVVPFNHPAPPICRGIIRFPPPPAQQQRSVAAAPGGKVDAVGLLPAHIIHPAGKKDAGVEDASSRSPRRSQSLVRERIAPSPLDAPRGLCVPESFAAAAASAGMGLSRDVDGAEAGTARALRLVRSCGTLGKPCGVDARAGDDGVERFAVGMTCTSRK
jgi:hypothetical protein